MIEIKVDCDGKLCRESVINTLHLRAARSGPLLAAASALEKMLFKEGWRMLNGQYLCGRCVHQRRPLGFEGSHEAGEEGGGDGDYPQPRESTR